MSKAKPDNVNQPHLSQSLQPQSSNLKSPFITAYGPKLRVQLIQTQPSRTKQSFKDECDVNIIMKRYQQTGILPGQERAALARYIDVTGLDYQRAMDVVASSRTLFEELPAAVRSRFENDPAKFLDFMHDPETDPAEMAEMGLLKPEAAARLADQAAAAAKAPQAPKAPEKAPETPPVGGTK